jgi:hypothetical protein
MTSSWDSALPHLFQRLPRLGIYRRVRARSCLLKVWKRPAHVPRLLQ